MKDRDRKQSRSAGKVSEPVKQIGQFDGFRGSAHKVFQFMNTGSVVVSHSCLVPSFSITMRVGELRRLVKSLRDEDLIRVRVSESEAEQITYAR